MGPVKAWLLVPCRFISGISRRIRFARSRPNPVAVGADLIMWFLLLIIELFGAGIKPFAR